MESSWIICCVVAVAAAVLWRFRWLLRVQRPEDGTATWGYVAISAGEKWALHAMDGSQRTLEGPVVVFCWGGFLTQLRRLGAANNQYLHVQFVDGTTEVTPGPAMLFVDPLQHAHAEVRQTVGLSDHELLVVYREENKAVKRHIVRGPCLYMPKSASEWLHEFCWHGSTSDDPERNGRKIKGAARFSKLRTCPEQSYIDVEGVRTRDDAVVKVKLMIFYRLNDVEQMLQQTHDPVADFVNAVSSDVVEFAGTRSFEEFKMASEKLNELAAYNQLVSRARNIGFEVTKVVFRGYGAPPQLQKMHDDAIERRTKLVLDRETQEQEQGLQDMKLEREEVRLRTRRQMDADAQEHRLMLQKEVQSQQRESERLTRQADLEATQAKARTAVKKQRAAAAAELEQLRQLKALGLSQAQLSAYLTSAVGKPQKLVRIAGDLAALQLGSI